LAINDIVIVKNGNTTKRTREKLQPFVKAKVSPATHIDRAKIIVPIFSPKAFCIALDSLLRRAESSEGLLVSNHELSYLSIDSRYLVRVLLTTLSLNSSRKEYMIYDENQIATPTQVKIKDIKLIVFMVSAGFVFGLNESIT